MALSAAVSSEDDAARAGALDRAASVYGGDLLDGTHYEWAEPIREDLRRRAADAAVRVADLHDASGNSGGALSALEHALRADPYCEEVYRRLMEAHARADHRDAARRTYRLLEKRLAEIDADPDDATLDAFRRIAAQPASATA